MPALTQIPSYFPTEFGTNWEFLVDQSISKLREYVRVDTITGKEKTYNQIESAAMSKVTTRAGDTTIVDHSFAKRWLRADEYEVANMLDKEDQRKLGEISAPNSSLIQSHAEAYARTCDSVIISAALGNAYTGEKGLTATSLPSSQKIASNYVDSGSPTDSGLTLSKLLRAKFLLDAASVSDENRIIVVSAQQIDNLLRDEKLTSADYNTVRTLAQGDIKSFLGFTFRVVKADLFPYNAGTGVRSVFAYEKSGLVLADAGREVFVDVRADKSHAIQLRTTASLGATRLQEAKVVQIDCDEVL